MNKEIADAIVKWFEKKGRRFPWRENPSPYSIFTAEWLLQRTKASIVARVYPEFMRRYPTLQSLAGADLNELHSFFGRIGLYYRAIRLVSAAKEIFSRYGEIPSTLDRLLSIRGIGIYMASAILNFGHGIPTPVVDKNVIRLMNRFRGYTDENSIRSYEQELFLHGDSRRIAYGLIDIGALICQRNPDCKNCPLLSFCEHHPLERNKWRVLKKHKRKDGRVVLHLSPMS